MHKIVRASLFVCISGISAPINAGILLGAGTEYMSWREYDDFLGYKMLEETGVRVFADATFSVPLASQVDLVGYGRFYTGDVNYDGETQPPEVFPVKTTTSYMGGLGELGVRYKPGLQDGHEASVALVATAGVERWSRDIHDTRATNNSGVTVPVSGYTEEWQIPYLRLGAEWLFPRREWIGKGGVFLPLPIQEEVGSMTLEPEGRPSLFLGAAYRFRNDFETGLNFQSYRFGKSNVNSEGYYQPRSELDTFGAYLRVAL